MRTAVDHQPSGDGHVGLNVRLSYGTQECGQQLITNNGHAGLMFPSIFGGRIVHNRADDDDTPLYKPGTR